MKIREFVKTRNPALKIVLVVDENNEHKLAESTLGKINGLIDSFIYPDLETVPLRLFS